MITVWTEVRDDQAAADPQRPTAAERNRANRTIRRRPLCDHGGYSGADPLTGITLCAICRRAQTRAETQSR